MTATVNLGLKEPCPCESGKKFKACCYRIPRKGWGWVAINQQYQPIAARIPDTGDIPVVLVHATYRWGMDYIMAVDMPRKVKSGIYLVRWALGDLLDHVNRAFRKGTRLYVVVPPEIDDDGQGCVIEAVAN